MGLALNEHEAWLNAGRGRNQLSVVTDQEDEVRGERSEKEQLVRSCGMRAVPTAGRRRRVGFWW